MLNRNKTFKVDKLARENKLGLGFVTIIEILKAEEICRDVAEAHKEYRVYDKLQEKRIEVEFEDIIKILKIEKEIRDEFL